MISTASRGNLARLWNAGTIQEEMSFRGHDSAVNLSVISPDGRWLVTASDDGTARVWGVRNGQEKRELSHDTSVKSAVFSPDGQWVVTSSDDDTARL